MAKTRAQSARQEAQDRVRDDRRSRNCYWQRLQIQQVRVFCTACFGADAVVATSPCDVCACLTEARLQKRTKHDVNIDVSLLRVPKSAWQSADDLKSKSLPEANGYVVRRYNTVELHRPKPKPARLVQTVLAHVCSHPESARLWCDHERRIGDMRTASGLIRPQNVSGNHLSPNPPSPGSSFNQRRCHGEHTSMEGAGRPS